MIGLKVQVQAGALTYDKRKLKAVMRAAGAEVAAVARKLIRSSAGGGRLYYGTGGAQYRGGYRKLRYQASGAGSAPVRVTGTLLGSIKAYPYPSGEGVAIRDTKFYALFLEGGAKGGVGSRKKDVKGKRNTYQRKKLLAVAGVRVLAPRPFLSTALESREASLGARIGASIEGDLKFVRVRA
jgi:uncharacterized protein (AIM24 family)